MKTKYTVDLSILKRERESENILNVILQTFRKRTLPIAQRSRPFAWPFLGVLFKDRVQTLRNGHANGHETL